jgi:DNA-binding transcriptional ArsR family regulator
VIGQHRVADADTGGGEQQTENGDHVSLIASRLHMREDEKSIARLRQQPVVACRQTAATANGVRPTGKAVTQLSGQQTVEPVPIDGSPAHHRADSAEAARVAHPEQPADEQVSAAVASLSMLAEPTRLRLLLALRDGELGVTELAERAGCRPTAASQHLSKLRLVGLVDQRAQGRARLYRLKGGHLHRLLDEALAHADHLAHDLPHHD